MLIATASWFSDLIVGGLVVLAAVLAVIILYIRVKGRFQEFDDTPISTRTEEFKRAHDTVMADEVARRKPR